MSDRSDVSRSDEGSAGSRAGAWANLGLAALVGAVGVGFVGFGTEGIDGAARAQAALSLLLLSTPTTVFVVGAVRRFLLLSDPGWPGPGRALGSRKGFVTVGVLATALLWLRESDRALQIEAARYSATVRSEAVQFVRGGPEVGTVTLGNYDLSCTGTCSFGDGALCDRLLRAAGCEAKAERDGPRAPANLEMTLGTRLPFCYVPFAKAVLRPVDVDLRVDVPGWPAPLVGLGQVTVDLSATGPTSCRLFRQAFVDAAGGAIAERMLEAVQASH